MDASAQPVLIHTGGAEASARGIGAPHPHCRRNQGSPFPMTRPDRADIVMRGALPGAA